jgi:Alpha-2-macroglobulin bait region domain
MKITRFFLIPSLLLTSWLQIPVLADRALEVLNIPEIASPGQKVTVTIKTFPNTPCKIEAQNESVTQALALMPIDADKSGKASWTFEINRNYKADKLPLIFTSSPAHNSVEKKLVTAISLPEKGTSAADLKIEKMPESAKPGEKVTLKVHTAPGARCKIEAQDTGIAEAMPLVDKTADNNGNASWTWQISEHYRADKLPVIVTSDYKNAERKMVSSIPINRM